MTRSEDNPSSLSEQDYTILAHVIAVIYSYFERFKGKKSRNPHRFFDQLMNMSKNEKIGLHILLDILGESDPGKLFEPKEFRTRIKNYQQILKFDNADQVIMSLHDEMSNHRFVRRQDIERALRSLEKVFDLVSIRGKKEIRKVKGSREKMKFLGNPSVERLGPSAIQIKKVLQNEMALQFISNALKNLGIIESLSLLFEGALITISGDEKGRSYELTKMMEFHLGIPEQRVSRHDGEKSRETMDLIIRNIKLISKRMAEVFVENPLFILIILPLALRRKSSR